MKKNSLFLVVVLMSVMQIAHADTDPSTGINTPGKATKAYNRVKFNAPGANDQGPIEIQGMCSIIPSASNPVAGPCVNFVVALNHADGSEYVKNRTTAQGKFSFEAENGQKYQIALGSKLYHIVSPKGFVQAGQKIDLRVEQK